MSQHLQAPPVHRFVTGQRIDGQWQSFFHEATTAKINLFIDINLGKRYRTTMCCMLCAEKGAPSFEGAEWSIHPECYTKYITPMSKWYENFLYKRRFIIHKLEMSLLNQFQFCKKMEQLAVGCFTQAFDQADQAAKVQQRTYAGINDQQDYLWSDDIYSKEYYDPQMECDLLSKEMQLLEDIDCFLMHYENEIYHCPIDGVIGEYNYEKPLTPLTPAELAFSKHIFKNDDKSMQIDKEEQKESSDSESSSYGEPFTKEELAAMPHGDLALFRETDPKYYKWLMSCYDNTDTEYLSQSSSYGEPFTTEELAELFPDSELEQIRKNDPKYYQWLMSCYDDKDKDDSEMDKA